MIVLLHIIYWTITQIRIRLKNKAMLNQDQITNENFFEENKVIYNYAITDAEIGLKFDPPLYLQRYSTVQEVLVNKNWREKIVKAIDFGCAELKFFKYLKNLINVQEILLIDIDEEILRNNACRVQPLTADYLSVNRRKRPLHVEVIQGSVDKPDLKSLLSDAVICIELIEHLYPDTLDGLPHNIFNFIVPYIAVFTTPNADFNVLFKNFSGFRHYDHKFEWTREQFEDWAQNIVTRYPKYSVNFFGIGPGPEGTEHLGSCSQMAVFIRKGEESQTKTNLVKNQTENLLDLSQFSSHGICTYQSFVKQVREQYHVVDQADYPFEIDNRTEEEIILHETEYQLHRIASYNKTENVKIPLYQLTSNRGGEFISQPELRTILEKAGWTVELCDIYGTETPCVVYDFPSSSSSSPCSPRSLSPNLNFSTDVNWDSESAVETWDDFPKMESNISDNWEDPPSADHEPCLDSPVSDPCVSGEQICATDEKVELLFDSGYQVSTSSIDLSPDLSKDWLSDEKKEENLDLKSSKSEKQCKYFDDSPSTMKSEGHISKPRKKNKNKVEDAVVVPRIPNIVVPAPVLEQGNPVVVENGDLANNNRDVEGNNYQAEENLIQIDDNALPRVENLDEDNENHIVLDIEPEIEIQEDDEAGDSLEDASREVLFDSNSEQNLSDDALIVQGHAVSFESYDLPPMQRLPQQPRSSSEDNFRTPLGFPIWLLQMLNISRDDPIEIEEENAHFYSQGDGVGVHPSTTAVDDDDTTSSDNSSHETEDSLLTNPNPTAVPSIEVSDESNYLDASDALPSGSEENPETIEHTRGQSSRSDNGS